MIRKNAVRYGIPADSVELATDGVHKIAVTDPEGKVHYAGRVGMNDYLLWQMKEDAGEVPRGTARAQQKSYLARASAIRGDWKTQKYSPNNLATKILWA